MNLIYNSTEENEPEVVTLRRNAEQLEKEWSISEALLASSQKDNELKHDTLEKQKSYIKSLEKLLGDHLGSTWRVDHDVAPLNHSTTTFHASTPLPKPPLSTLRHSASISFSGKRSSRAIFRNTVMDLSSLKEVEELQDCVATDDTPTGALKKLGGKQAETAVLSAPVPLAGRIRGSHLQSTDSTRDEGRCSSPKTDETSAGLTLDQNQVNRLLLALQSLPKPRATSVAESSLPHHDGFSKSHLAAMEYLLKEAESRSEARERRLTFLVATAKEEVQRFSAAM